MPRHCRGYYNFTINPICTKQQVQAFGSPEEHEKYVRDGHRRMDQVTICDRDRVILFDQTAGLNSLIISGLRGDQSDTLFWGLSEPPPHDSDKRSQKNLRTGQNISG